MDWSWSFRSWPLSSHWFGVTYTVHISRLAQRSRKTALAMEIADGHLEFLFTNWRNIYRSTWTTTRRRHRLSFHSLLTNYFFTDSGINSVRQARYTVHI